MFYYYLLGDKYNFNKHVKYNFIYVDNKYFPIKISNHFSQSQIKQFYSES